jgi:TIR domain
MTDYPTFQAFFSYAHHDADVDPQLVEAFSATLEDRVNAKLLNARFSIWRDHDSLRTGEKWAHKIESVLRTSHILVVLLTPRWIESAHCRHEYTLFEKLEARRNVGEYVIPILARSIDKQEKYLTSEQRHVFDNITERQYQRVLATDFLRLNDAEQVAIVDNIADDIEGIIERLRTAPQPTPSRVAAHLSTAREFDAKAHNYEEVDFVRNVEVLLDQRSNDRKLRVLAQVDFVDRLYVQGTIGRIEFGVRRALLSLENEGSGGLEKADGIKRGNQEQSARYMTLHEAPRSLTICMDPPVGKSSLAELALPPGPNENYLSEIATASSEVTAEGLKATLLVSMNAEGLYLVNTKENLSRQSINKIKCIMDIAAAKAVAMGEQTFDANGQLRRTLMVRDRT